MAVALCAAAWTERRTRHTFGARHVVAAALGAAAIVVTSTALRAASLPVAVEDGSRRAELVHSLPVRSVRLVGVVLLLAATIGFARRTSRRHDDVLMSVSAAAVLLAAARLHEFFYPSMHTNWLATADVLRVVAQVLLVIAGTRELRRLWLDRVANASLRERRRLAAELHDGLAQELAFLSTHSVLAYRDPDNREHLMQLRVAAERALTEARLAITEYARADAVSLDSVLRELADDVEERYGCVVVVDLERVVADAATAHELARTAREALGNAARHGRPERIVMRLQHADGTIRLHVADDGVGLGAPSPTGYGLTSIRERIARLGGSFAIAPAGAGGTVVAVEVPER